MNYNDVLRNSLNTEAKMDSLTIQSSTNIGKNSL